MKRGYNMSNSNNVIFFDNYIHTPLTQTQADLEAKTVSQLVLAVREKDKQIAEKDKQIAEKDKQIQVLQQEKIRTPHPFIAELRQWLERRKAIKEIRPNSYDKCKTIINVHIAPFFNAKDKELDTADVTRDMIKDFIANVRGQGKDPTAKEALNTIITPFLTEMYSEQLIPFNVAMNIRLRNMKKADKRAITFEEVEKISSVAKEMTPYQWIAVPLLAYTGMRRGELLALTWEDIDMENKLIYIHNTNSTSSEKSISIEERTKTESGTRYIPISDPLYEALTLHRDMLQIKGSHWIIRQLREDKPMNVNNFNRNMRKWRDNAGVKPDVACHAFRHLYSTLLAINAVDVNRAKLLLGHSDARMYTKVYTDTKLLAQTSPMQDVQNLVAKSLIN